MCIIYFTCSYCICLLNHINKLYQSHTLYVKVGLRLEHLSVTWDGSPVHGVLHPVASPWMSYPPTPQEHHPP